MLTRDEGQRGSADRRSAEAGACIVMVCASMSEADEVGRQLAELDVGRLVIYRRAVDLLHNVPAGKVVLVILASRDNPAMLARTLRWLRRRWSRCPVAVVGDGGCNDFEMAAREGGANYLVRPVSSQQWSALLQHAFQQLQRKAAEEVSPPAPGGPG